MSKKLDIKSVRGTCFLDFDFPYSFDELFDMAEYWNHDKTEYSGEMIGYFSCIERANPASQVKYIFVIEKDCKFFIYKTVNPDLLDKFIHVFH